MTTLPASRRVIEGRTHSRAWSPADSDPIERYTVRRYSTAAYAIACIAGCIVIGLLIGAAL